MPSPQCPSWMISSCSSSTSIRSFIDRNGKPYAVCSISDQPVPSPSSIRPPEMWSAVVASLASTDGCRKRGRRDHRPQPQRRRPRGERADRAPGVERAALAFADDGHVVVGTEERLDPRALAGIGQCDPVVPGHVLLALDHQGDPHKGESYPLRAVSRAVVWTLYAACVLVWSSTWVVIAVGLEDIEPFFGAGIRFALAGVGLLAGGALFGRPLKTDFALSALVGLLPFATTYGLIYWAEQYVTSGLTAVLFGVLPLYVALLAAVLLPAEPLRARLRARRRDRAGRPRRRLQREPRHRLRRAHRAGRAGGDPLAAGQRGRQRRDQEARREDRPADDERLGDADRRRRAAARLRADRGLGRHGLVARVDRLDPLPGRVRHRRSRS